jgi:hypothetical protein
MRHISTIIESVLADIEKRRNTREHEGQNKDVLNVQLSDLRTLGISTYPKNNKTKERGDYERK